MGEIVAARNRHQRRVLLVGQAPGADEDLRPLTGTMGVELARLASVPRFQGVPEDELIGLWFDRANVLDYYPGPDAKGKGHLFPLGHARVAAAAMWPRVREYDRVLFCGRAVFEVFRTARHRDVNRRRKEWRSVPMLDWHVEMSDDLTPFTFAWMPHTSKVVRWWNEPENVERARLFLEDLLLWTRRGMRRVA